MLIIVKFKGEKVCSIYQKPVERIQYDSDFWENELLPKLTTIANCLCPVTEDFKKIKNCAMFFLLRVLKKWCCFF